MVSKEVIRFLEAMKEFNELLKELNHLAGVEKPAIFSMGLDYDPEKIVWQLTAYRDGVSKVIFESKERQRVLGYMKCLTEDPTKLKGLLGPVTTQEESIQTRTRKVETNGPTGPSSRVGTNVEWSRMMNGACDFASGNVKLVSLGHPDAVKPGTIVRVDGDGVVVILLPETAGSESKHWSGVISFSNFTGLGEWEVLSLTKDMASWGRVVTLRNPDAAHHLIKIVEG